LYQAQPEGHLFPRARREGARRHPQHVGGDQDARRKGADKLYNQQLVMESPLKISRRRVEEEADGGSYKRTAPDLVIENRPAAPFRNSRPKMGQRDCMWRGTAYEVCRCLVTGSWGHDRGISSRECG
jgi:hypothetical protein